MVVHSSDDDSSEEEVIRTRQGLTLEHGYYTRSKNQEDSPAPKSQQRHQYMAPTLQDYLFKNERGRQEINCDVIRKAYSAYTTLLSNTYRQLKKHY